MNRIATLIFILLLWVTVGINNAALCRQNHPLASLDEYITFKLERDHIPGLVACIIKGDSIAWSKGYGLRNLEQKHPMTMQSVIDVASITKLVTATAVMQLVENGRINLSDPINKLLPFKIHHPVHPDADITIEQLLSHTASTSNGPSLWRTYSCAPQTLTLKEWVRAYFLPDGQYFHKEGNFAESKPGEQFLYSNAGYTLLAYIVEVASGTPFSEYCRKKIFEPLEMHNTSLEISYMGRENLCTMYAYGYNSDIERDLMQPGVDCSKIIGSDYFFPLCNYTTPTIGAGGLYSSTEDLSKLLIAFMYGGALKDTEVLKTTTAAKMLTAYVDSKLLGGHFAAFGLGTYAIRLTNGEPVWGHSGADPGTSTFMFFDPDTKIGAIVLANRFVDIRDLIEWFFAEGIAHFGSKSEVRKWRTYTSNQPLHKVTFRVVPNYLPGGSMVHVIGNHRYLGCWVQSGIPMLPQKDRSWEKTFIFPDSTRLEFKFTRGDMKKEAVTQDGNVLPNCVLVVVRDTVFNMVVQDWKDLTQ